MKYSKGYKYQLESGVEFRTLFCPAVKITTSFITLHPNGVIKLIGGYACDGPSGGVHTKLSIYISFLHDALYQLMRLGLLPYSQWRKADWELYRSARRKLPSQPLHVRLFWAGYLPVVMAVLFVAGGKYAHPKHRKKIFTV